MLPIFIILTGCDSASSTTVDNSKNQTTSVSSAQDTDRKNTVETLQDNDEADNEIDEDDDGQTLLAAARLDDGAHTQRTPMISRKRDDSTLQATLMGDYGGMLPCSFCDNIDSTLNLFADGSVLKTSIYNNPESPKVPLAESGVYRQDGNTIIIVYENKIIETYHIQDNHLVMIGKDKNPDADYTLSRK